MNINEKLKKYKEYKERVSAYKYLFSVAGFDKETIAPVGGNDFFNKKLNYMVGEAYKIENDKEIYELINDLSKEDLGEELNREIYLSKKNLENVMSFTKEETMEFDLACSSSFDAWLRAKNNNNYDEFAPYLEKLIVLSKDRAKKRNPNILPYNLYLSDYEDGTNILMYDKFFDLLKKELIPLIKEVNKRQDKVDDSFLYKYYPKDKQVLFSKELLKYLGFDASWGYMGESEHPFTSGFSKYDVRITTNYNEHNVVSNIFSIIHEVGHAHYEHNIDSEYDDLEIRFMVSSGMHESQSRFLENYIGKRKSFWVNLYPKLQELFPENLSNVSLDDFCRAINVSRSSLIRTDADELTYPMHILIRYEIEKGIFDGSIDFKDLSKIWKEKYKEYLGIDVKDDASGILQDVHWASASFGYFPTYALGSAMGAQIYKQLEKDEAVDYLLENNHLDIIIDYLKDTFQKYGALYDYDETLLILTNERFDPRYYVDYLKNKYKKLYEIKED